MNLLGKGLPKHLNRIANIGSLFHRCVPSRWLVLAPVEERTINTQMEEAAVGEESTGDESLDDMEICSEFEHTRLQQSKEAIWCSPLQTEVLKFEAEEDQTSD